jgi:hypothetical protein
MRNASITDYITDFSELAIAERSTLIDLDGSIPLSSLRDTQQTSGTGSITDTASEYEINHAASGDFARLAAAKRGRYQPGTVSQVGIGVRATGDITDGDARRIWGYFDMVKSGRDDTENIEDGIFFGEDIDGIFVQLVKDGTTTFKTYQKDWNVAPNYPINLKNGAIFQISFVYYGYGPIKFFYQDFTNGDARQEEILLHSFSPDGETTVSKPSLLVGALVESSNSSDDFSLFVGGRKYSIEGRTKPKTRITTEKNLSVTVGTSSFVPLISVRRKVDFRQISIDILSFSVLTNQNVELMLRVNSTLTAASFGDVSDTDQSETASEVDTSATAIDISTGVKISQGLASAASGTNSFNATSEKELPFDIGDDVTLTLCAKAISTSATVSGILSIVETW